MTNRSSLYTLVLIALVSWGGLLFFTHQVSPLVSPALPAFIAFFLILTIALTSTVAPIAYMIDRIFFSVHSHQVPIRNALRRGALFALIIVLNLMLRTLNSWNVFTAILIALAVIVVEVMVVARK
jgi:hypothetical protein